MSQILVFGDSIAYGAWDIEGGGWVARLRKFIDQRIIESNQEIYHVVYNLGVDGDQSEGVLNRIENEIEVRAWDDELIILIAIGTNDAIVFNETNQPVVSLEKYQKNLEAIVRKAQTKSKKVILVGLTPVDESRMSPIPWLDHHNANNKTIKEFDSIMESVAKLNHVHYIPVFDSLTPELLEDGDHPNSEGHEKIYLTVLDYLKTNNIINL